LNIKQKKPNKLSSTLQLRSTSPSSSKRTFKSNGLAIAVEKEWRKKEWTTAKSGKMNRFRWKGEHQLNRKGDGPSARPHNSALAAEKMVQNRAMQRKLELRNTSAHSQNAPCNEGAHRQNASAHGRNAGTRASACKRPGLRTVPCKPCKMATNKKLIKYK
jgi:hypothetical protein